MEFNLSVNKEVAKRSAAAIRRRLAALGVDISHSQALEAFSAACGDPSWNVTSARIEFEDHPRSAPSESRGMVPIIWFDISEAKETIDRIFPGISDRQVFLLLDAYSKDCAQRDTGHWNATDPSDIYRTNFTDVWLEEVFLAGNLENESQELAEIRSIGAGMAPR